MERNSFSAWWKAIRPKTLSGASVPVIIALSAAWRDEGSLLWIPALLCLLFALLMQIDANLVNDYYDWVDGIDTEERQGPERAMAQGWVTEKSMRLACWIVTALACLAGLPLIYWGGFQMIWIGAVCVAFCFLYTIFFSRRALGDILVLVFFGLIPVCATYFIQTDQLNTPVILLSLAIGLATDCMLVVNNYRDRENDARVGKQTFATIFGPAPTRLFFLFLGLAATALSCPILGLRSVFMLPYLAFHLVSSYRIYTETNPQELNKLLERTAFSILLFGISVSAILISF